MSLDTAVDPPRIGRGHPSRAISRGLLMACGAVGGCVALGFTAATLDASAASVFFLSTTATTVVAGLVLRSEHRRGDVFSPLGLLGVFYLLAFVAGGLYYWFGAPGLEALESVDVLPFRDPDGLAQASLVGLVGLCAAVLGYRLNPFRVVTRLLPAIPVMDSRALLRATVVLFLAGWLARVVTVATGGYFHIQGPGAESLDPRGAWFVTLGTLLPLVGTALIGAVYYFRHRDGSPGSRLRWLFWGLVMVEVAWAIPSGARGTVIALLAMVLVVRYYGTSRLPSRWATILGLAILVLFFFPFAERYRDVGQYQQDPAASAATALEDMSRRSPTEMVEAGVATTLNRFADITSVAAIAETPGNQTRFASGETLRWIPETVVPRFLYPDKYNPGHYGNEFGRSYGITYTGNFSTSVAISQPGELLLNFGMLGVLLGMPLVGGAYRVIGDCLAGRRGNALVLAVYGAFAWELISGQEVIIALGLAGAVKTIVVLLLVTGILAYAFSGTRVARTSPRPAPG